MNEPNLKDGSGWHWVHPSGTLPASGLTWMPGQPDNSFGNEYWAVVRHDAPQLGFRDFPPQLQARALCMRTG